MTNHFLSSNFCASLCSNKISSTLKIILVLIIFLNYANGELTLVTSEDYIEINGPDDSVKEEISGFINYPHYNENNTESNARGCYSDASEIEINYIKTECLDKLPNTTDWVLFIPFNNQRFTSNLRTIDERLPSIKSVVFLYSGTPQITNPAPDTKLPKIISFAKKEKMDKIGLKDKIYPISEDYTITHDHYYDQFCNVMKPAYNFFVASLIIWSIAVIVHIAWTWWIKRSHSTHLQKIIAFVPIFFLAYTLIDYFFFKSCPWLGNSGVQYLQIVQIALITIFNTLFVGLCCFISKGWAIIRRVFTREELSSITMIVGIFYLVYSAYFIASDIPALKLVIIIIMTIMYVWVSVTCLKNSIDNVKMLQSHIQGTANDEVILEALKLKRYLMKAFTIICTMYYANKIAHTILYTFIDDNIACRYLIIYNLMIELLIIGALLFTFRSRKWPEYFTLDIMYRSLQGASEDQENIIRSVILSSKVDSEWVTKHANPHYDIQSDDFHKKSFKDPKMALLLEVSDQDRYRLINMSHQDFRADVFSNMKLVIEEREEELSDSSI